MATITNLLEKLIFGNPSQGTDKLTYIGSFLHNIVADATYAPTETKGSQAVTYTPNENFHPYSAMMRATIVAFLTLWGINALNNRLPYQVQGMVKDVGRAATLIPLFHLYGTAINSIRDQTSGKPSVVVNKAEDEC